MPTAIVTKSNGKVTQVQLVPAEGTEDTVVDAEVMATTSAAEGETTAEVKSPPNPISIAPNELAWTAGSFFVLLIVMRYYLFPKLKKATNARYDSIRADIEGADEVKQSARTAVSEYEAARAVASTAAGKRLSEFETQLKADYGLCDSEFSVIWGEAYNRGHSGGLHEVYSEFDSLCDFVHRYVETMKGR